MSVGASFAFVTFNVMVSEYVFPPASVTSTVMSCEVAVSKSMSAPALTRTSLPTISKCPDGSLVRAWVKLSPASMSTAFKVVTTVPAVEFSSTIATCSAELEFQPVPVT